MSDPSIAISGTRSSYRPGETIRGEVTVWLSRPADCRSLTIATQYRTDGAVPVFASEPRSRQLFSGAWPAGEHRYPFELTAPPGPATYRGNLVQVMHWLVARADLAMKSDPVTECRFEVAAEDARDYDDGPGGLSLSAAGGAPEPFDPHAAPRGCIVPVGLAFISAVGLLFLVLMISQGLQGFRAELLLAFPIALAFFAGPLVGAFVLYRGRFAGRGLGRPDVMPAQRNVRAGESLSVRVRYRAPRGLRLTRAVLSIECTERSFTGTGKHRREHQETLVSEKLPLDVPQRLAAGETIDRAVEFPVPEDAAPSFAAPGAGVLWSVGVHIGAGRGRFVSRVVPLTVRPRAAS